MKKIKDSIKYIKLRDLTAPFIFLLIIIPALIFKLINRIKKRQLWLIFERDTYARDNGYHFYKYVRTEHPNDFCFYVIDKKCKDYNKVKEYGNIIQYRSLKHWLYYLAADYNISNNKNGNPNQPFFYVIHVVFGLFKNRVFLQHGITKDDAKWLYYKNTKFKYFICGAKREFDFIKERFGYPEGNVIYTGFPRFDNLYNNKIDKKQLLIMPTWRNWLGRETNNFAKKEDITKTEFFKNWNELLTNKEFVEFIEKEDIKVLFYPHSRMQSFLNKFEISSKNIKLVDTSTDIQKVLKESALLITDYSSVYMDFAYMIKPVIYFQFDYKEYREKQYQDGYYDYKKDGFGPVETKTTKMIETIINVYKNGLEKKYYDRMNAFFEIKDKKNSERIYKILKGE
jgi:CDP-glycerol glycerophosphotransferase (TagB/SpsB family)